MFQTTKINQLGSLHQVFRGAYFCCVGVLVFCCIGCSKDSEDTTIENPSDLNETDSGLLASQQIVPSTKSGAIYDPTSAEIPERDQELGTASAAAAMSTTPELGGQATDLGIVGNDERPFSSPLTLAEPAEEKNQAPDAVAKGLQLRPDLSPDELVVFLGQADQFMQLLLSGRGITDRREAFEEMTRVARVKLEASRRLSSHPDADAKQRVEGARGEMQSLSHLAAQNDMNSADELTELANENLNSDDPQLVADSRVVLIGFAIEDLQAGKKDAADRIVSLVQSVDSTEQRPDIPALMMMGHARSSLAQYEFDEQAVIVRQRIIDLFAGSSDPEIAKMAAQAAGNVRFDTVEKLRATIVAGKPVAKDQWIDSVNELVNEAPDLVTVQYLAGAALEFEASSVDELASATYEVLQDRFDDPKKATGREVTLAMQARAARQQVVGNVYAPDLPSINGSSMPLSKHQGKVILMPFWATGFPQSLQVVPMLHNIRKAHPDDVVIVGMNLDPAGTRVEEFKPDEQLGFPSYRSESSVDQGVGNPVATQFGMVSMPFVVILDQDQRIVALDFTGSKLKPTVEKLLQK